MFKPQLLQNMLKNQILLLSKVFLDTQKDTIPNSTIEEDEYGIPIAHRDFLMKLSNQVKKNAAKRFYAKRAKMKTEK